MIFIPPPWGVVSFLVLAVISTVLVGGVPVYDSIVQRAYNQCWVQPKSDPDYSRWQGRFQLWWKHTVVASAWIPSKRKWLSHIITEIPYAHPKYNNRKRILRHLFVWHGIEDILHGEDLSTFSDDEKQEMGKWETLMSARLAGGPVVWGAYAFYNAHSLWMTVREEKPKREKMTLPQLGADGKPTANVVEQILHNHVPVVIPDGRGRIVAIPLFTMTDCLGAEALREQVVKRNQRLAQKAIITIGPKGIERLTCPDCGEPLTAPDGDNISVCVNVKCSKRWDLTRPKA